MADRPPPARRAPVGPARQRPANPQGSTTFVSPWVQLRSANNHPFIFRRMVDRVDPAAHPGDVVSVYDRAGAYFGRGFYHDRSQIALRMLTYIDEPVDEDFWRRRIQQAFSLRQSLRVTEQTDAYRIVHAEGDELSGLIAERYADCLVLELFSLGMFLRRELIVKLLGEVLGQPISLDRPGRAPDQWRVVVRADEHVEKMESFQVKPPEGVPPIVIREHGIRYRVDVAGGHKTGFFCDQRDNRLKFARLCSGANVLDVCCYSGGFGLCARKLGDAKAVTSVDLDEGALELARDNANLNQLRIDHARADSFVYLRQMQSAGRRFEAVVLDPPKFAPSRVDVDTALRKYHDLNVLGFQSTAPGGFLLTCSCSGLVPRDEFVRLVLHAGRHARRTVQILEIAGASADHPVLANCPETEYLKAVFLRVL